MQGENLCPEKDSGETAQPQGRGPHLREAPRHGHRPPVNATFCPETDAEGVTLGGSVQHGADWCLQQNGASDVKITSLPRGARGDSIGKVTKKCGLETVERFHNPRCGHVRLAEAHWHDPSQGSREGRFVTRSAPSGHPSWPLCLVPKSTNRLRGSQAEKRRIIQRERGAETRRLRKLCPNISART